jgi:hypothetical protein
MLTVDGPIIFLLEGADGPTYIYIYIVARTPQ